MLILILLGPYKLQNNVIKEGNKRVKRIGPYRMVSMIKSNTSHHFSEFQFQLKILFMFSR